MTVRLQDSDTGFQQSLMTTAAAAAAAAATITTTTLVQLDYLYGHYYDPAP